MKFWIKKEAVLDAKSNGGWGNYMWEMGLKATLCNYVTLK